VARFEPQTDDAFISSDTSEPVAFEVSGFLGLQDDPVFVHPAPPAKKKWWQKRSA